MLEVNVNALKESLEKKKNLLIELKAETLRQYEMTKVTPFPYAEFDKSLEDKSVLIYKIGKLDDGFEIVYNNIKEEINTNKERFAADVATMQNLIREITELEIAIQTAEARNKTAMETALKKERSKLKAQRSGVKAVQSYTQTMRNMPGKLGDM